VIGVFLETLTTILLTQKKLIMNKQSLGRRDFLTKSMAAGGFVAFGGNSLFSAEHAPDNIKPVDGKILKIKQKDITYFKPLDLVTVSGAEKGTVVVRDGAGHEYFRSPAKEEIQFRVAGTLGFHQITLEDKKGRIEDIAVIPVNCQTEIKDEGDEFRELLDMLHFSVRDGYGSGDFFRIQGDLYFTYAGWYQDHVHVLKAMKYFYPDVKSGIDMWAVGQRKDGMLADNCYQNLSSYKSWLNRFGERFVWKMGPDTENSTYNIRIPVENMSEFTFLDAVYNSWKASGDDEWMAGKIDNCLKAIKYATTDEYRWSKKYQLLKRGYTIDIWDFQPAQDVEVWDGDIMMAKPGVTKYSIMYGDNVGFYVGCEYVGEMLEYLGRKNEAEEIRKIGRGIKERLDKLSWNGDFYTHHVPEDPDHKRDFGDTDLDSQVTISSSYAINRRIGHDKSVSLIKTYRRIKEEMPDSSPGEWYMCYPPYEKGWHNPKWEYMNGGVSSIVAGELAHGAFWHGYEAYGVDILRRANKMAKELSNNYMKCIYRGVMPEKPKRNFTPVSLKEIANADTYGTKGAKGVPAFTGEGGNDFQNFPVGRQIFHDVPFEFVDPSENGRKACLILSGDEGYVQNTVLPTGKQAASIYIVHAQSHGNYMGDVVLNYEDGTKHTEHVVSGQNIAGWWYPREQGRGSNYKLAWEGKNDKSISIGAYIWGFNNPHSDKTIKSIEFKGTAGKEKWIIMGLTLGNEPVFYMPSPVSYGAPDNWGAAAVMYAILEGLAGAKDTGVAFDRAKLAPRWDVAGVNQAEATVKYEASGGYLRYKYQKQDNKFVIDFTGTAGETEIELLIPKGKDVKSILLNGKEQPHEIKKVEQSVYAAFKVEGIDAHTIEIIV
jgi:hypothetical protein